MTLWKESINTPVEDVAAVIAGDPMGLETEAEGEPVMMKTVGVEPAGEEAVAMEGGES